MFSYSAMQGLGYVNADGFVTVEKNANHIPGDGNGWLQTGVWACGVESFSSEVAMQMKYMLRRCRYSVEIPLIWRSPHKRNPGDNQNHDDFWGALAISFFLKGDWAKEIVAWGEAKGWIFDVSNPEAIGPRYYFTRFFDFVPFARLCAGQKLSLAENLILAGTILIDSFRIEKADGNMRAFCKITVAKRCTLACALAALLWEKRIRKRYGTIGKSWAEYFGEGHPCNLYEGK